MKIDETGGRKLQIWLRAGIFGGFCAGISYPLKYFFFGQSSDFGLSQWIPMGAILIGISFLFLISRSKKFTASFLSAFMRVWLIPCICVFTALFALFFLRSAWLLYLTTEKYHWFVIYQRFIPIAIWIGFLSISALSLFYSLHKKEIAAEIGRRKKKYIFTAAFFFAGLLAWIMIRQSGLGLSKENAFFGKPTVPLLEWHLLLGFLVCLISFMAEITFAGKSSAPGSFANTYKFIKKSMPFLIWLFAVIVWLSIPNQHGFFSPAGRAPNFQTYPFSDGSFYGHYARSLSAGMGFKGNDIPPRPLYIALLSIFHALAANDYDTVILFQTLLLGLMPAGIYLIGKELHSGVAGVFAACLAIFRETNAILSAPFGHNVSTTKYFFSDLPTALSSIFLLLCLLRWLKTRENGAKAYGYAVLTGCLMAIMTLIRTQSLCLLLIILFAMLRSGKRENPRAAMLETGVFLTILTLCLSPWLIRNYSITGKFVFDHPMTQTAEMARNYNFDQQDLGQRAGENDGDYTARLTAAIQSSVKKHPEKIARFILAHFINNEICNLRLFPVRDSLSGLMDLARPKTAFWETVENDSLSPYNLFALGLAFLVLTYGLGAALQINGNAGFLAAAFCLLFNLSTAVGRYSAGRYLIPLDWVLFLYFSIGAAEWLRALSRIGGVQLRADNRSKGSANSNRKTVLCGVCLSIFTMALIPLCEKGFPTRFTPENAATVYQRLNLPPDESENAIAMKAIAIYPRYYAAGEGEPESAKQGYATVDYGRLVFLTLSPENFGTIELRTNEPVMDFPDGSIVRLAGRQRGATTIATIAQIERENEIIVYYGDENGD